MPRTKTQLAHQDAPQKADKKTAAAPPQKKKKSKRHSKPGALRAKRRALLRSGRVRVVAPGTLQRQVRALLQQEGWEGRCSPKAKAAVAALAGYLCANVLTLAVQSTLTGKRQRMLRGEDIKNALAWQSSMLGASKLRPLYEAMRAETLDGTDA